MKNLFNVLIIASVTLMVISILLQARGASLGASFGGESNFYRSKRGAEKVLYNATVIFAVIFVLAVIFSLLSN